MSEERDTIELRPDTEMMKDLEPIKDAPVSMPTGIAALALNMALKYHDTTIIKDGAMYQQYKLEGRNLTPLHLDVVFETAIQIERHLLGANERIGNFMIDTFKEIINEIPDGGGDQETVPSTGGEMP